MEKLSLFYTDDFRKIKRNRKTILFMRLRIILIPMMDKDKSKEVSSTFTSKDKGKNQK